MSAGRWLDTDVVVVGAGGCGLTAALAAAQRGARVLLLERAAAAGGATALSAGLFVAAGSRLQRAGGHAGTADQLADNILQLNQFQSDPAVTRALCRASGPLMDWLQDHGVLLEHLPGYRYPGMSDAWLVAAPSRHGADLVAPLLAALPPAVDWRLETAVTGLRTDGDRVVGVRAETAGGLALAVRARAVILAAAGFAANEALVARHMPELAGAPSYGTPYATGDAIDWGVALGGTVAHMGAYQTHSSIAYPQQMLVTTYLINRGAIQVNQAGERFGDETDSYARHAIAVRAQPGGVVVELFDERILQAALAGYPRFAACLEAGIVRRAETLAALAATFALDAARLETAVADYNRAVDGGQDRFGRRLFDRPLAAPFYGIRVTSALVQTLGGLRVDARARVLRADGLPIPGLYAGGGTAAGFAGDAPEGYMAGTGLLAAFGLGWIAGRAAAGPEAAIAAADGRE